MRGWLSNTVNKRYQTQICARIRFDSSDFSEFFHVCQQDPVGVGWSCWMEFWLRIRNSLAGWWIKHIFESITLTKRPQRFLTMIRYCSSPTRSRSSYDALLSFTVMASSSLAKSVAESSYCNMEKFRGTCYVVTPLQYCCIGFFDCVRYCTDDYTKLFLRNAL